MLHTVQFEFKIISIFPPDYVCPATGPGISWAPLIFIVKSAWNESGPLLVTPGEVTEKVINPEVVSNELSLSQIPSRPK